MTKTSVILRDYLWIVLGFLAAFWPLNAQTALTYEGRLTDNGAPATGIYDFQFFLWNDATAGGLASGPIFLMGQGVTNGLFSVNLNFSSSAFNGGARWLELRVRTNGVGTFFALLPRQAINATPYALYAMTPAGPAGPTGATGAVGPTGPQGPVGPPGTTSASEIIAGTLDDARLSANIPRINDLSSVSNSLLTRLVATNSTLLARIADLEIQLTTVSNFINYSAPAGSVAMSADPADSSLAAKGYFNFSTLPATQWIDGATENAPSARFGHSAIWTGTEMIVWGGVIGENVYSGGGARYSPGLNAWTTLTTYLAPPARHSHSAIWTGDKMILWGGFTAGGAANTGGRFSPLEQNWAPTATANAPVARADHIAVWTGSRMVIWGGRTLINYLDDGGIYNPATDTWSGLPLGPAPRFGATAIWTGDRMIVWGGEYNTGVLNSGSRLPISASGVASPWQATSVLNAPSARSGHTAVWTGQRMLIWGGRQSSNYFDSGAAYDPVADAWTVLPTLNAPSARANHVAVWTGAEMVIFGGENAAGALNTGAAYDPVSNKWRSLDGRGPAVVRTQAAAVWSGAELIVFGGEANAQPIGSLQRLNPQPAWHLFRKP